MHGYPNYMSYLVFRYRIQDLEISKTASQLVIMPIISAHVLTHSREVSTNFWGGLGFVVSCRQRYANLKHYGGSNHLLVPTGLLQEPKKKRDDPQRAFFWKKKYMEKYLGSDRLGACQNPGFFQWKIMI